MCLDRAAVSLAARSLRVMAACVSSHGLAIGTKTRLRARAPIGRCFEAIVKLELVGILRRHYVHPFMSEIHTVTCGHGG